MRTTIRVSQCLGIGVAILVLPCLAGCVAAASLGVKVVGQVVSDADVAEQSNVLLNQPAAQADATFGQRIRTLQDVRTNREMWTYPVKNDALSLFRWAVEVENGSIVAVSKLAQDPDGGKNIIEKTVVKEQVIGKTPQEVQAHSYFKNQILTLRDRQTGQLLRVYDTSNVTDFMGARYCVLEFDRSEHCQRLSLVGIPGTRGRSAIGS